jgi:hypothetical protein
MHNARILSCTHLSNLCLAQSSESKQNNNCDLFGSERLHLLMNLYGRELSAVVLIVNQDPYWHIRKRTKFALLCELSAELHFDSLETQLVKIEEQVVALYMCTTEVNTVVYQYLLIQYRPHVWQLYNFCLTY